MTEALALYRFLDANGNLLYVGRTNNLPARLVEHASDKGWWCEVSVVTVEHFWDAAALAEKERVTIKEQGPRYNVVHNGAVQKPRRIVRGKDALEPGEGVLAGFYFFTFRDEPDGCRLVEKQGRVLREIDGGRWLVLVYEWLMGQPYALMVVSIEDMGEWMLYSEQEWAQNTYENVFGLSADIHHRDHATSQTHVEVSEVT